MASAEHKPKMGVWGQKSRLAQGESPWSGGSGKAPEAESFKAFAHLKKAQKAVRAGCLSIFQCSCEQVLPSRGGGKCPPCPCLWMITL